MNADKIEIFSTAEQIIKDRLKSKGFNKQIVLGMDGNRMEGFVDILTEGGWEGEAVYSKHAGVLVLGIKA